MVKENSVTFDSVSPKIKDAVQEILEHRQQFKSNTKVFSGMAIPTIGLFGLYGKTGLGIKAMHLTWTAFLAGAGTKLVRNHNPKFRKEYLALYKAVKNSRKSEAFKALVTKFPYLVVDGKGNLIGKKKAPHLFKIPIGRRRVISPKAGINARKIWKRKYLPKARRK